MSTSTQAGPTKFLAIGTSKPMSPEQRQENMLKEVTATQVDAYRKQLNTFILTSGVYDGTADFSAATTDPATGTLQAPFVPDSEGSAGDYLHPNRYGYQVMGQVAASAVLSLIRH